MTEFDIAFNESTTLYEVHAAGCRHTAMNPRLEVMVTVEGATGVGVADMFEATNDGVITRLGPCAR